MRRIWILGPGLLAGLMLGCGDEGPTSVGSDLLGPGVHTYELILESSAFLVEDTTYNRIGTLNDATFFTAAHRFEGEVEARTLFSLERPAEVTYTYQGSSRRDTIQELVGGTLTLIVDSVATTPGPIEVAVARVGEEWHRASATWTVRIDTAGVTEQWTTPGAGTGEVLATGTWVGGDTLQIELDAAAVAVWDDSAAARFGGLVQSTTPESRIFFREISFSFDVIPVGVDTIVPAGRIVTSKIITTPDEVAPPPGVLRVGGLPAWRSLLRFRPLAELQVPCPPGAEPSCTLGLDEVTINLASLLVKPVGAGARRVERPVWLEARALMEAPGVPLVRTPLTPPVGPPTDTLPVAWFSGTTAAPTVALPVTAYVRRHLEPDLADAVPLWLALTAGAERTHFGYMAFAGIQSETPPRLRLVLSVPEDVLIR
jgi:hypothetical protein